MIGKELSYMNANIFVIWLQGQFVPRKPSDEVSLLWDAHRCHFNDCQMLDFARNSDIVLLSLSFHTAKCLHSIDRIFLSPWKSIAIENVILDLWLTKYAKSIDCSVGVRLGTHWGKAALNSDPSTGWKMTGMYPLDVICSNWFQHAYKFNITNRSGRWHFSGNTKFSYSAVILYVCYVRSAPVLCDYLTHRVSVFNVCLGASASVFYYAMFKIVVKSWGKMYVYCAHLSVTIQVSQDEKPAKILTELLPPPEAWNLGPSRMKRNSHGGGL